MDYSSLSILSRCPQAPLPDLGQFSHSAQHVPSVALPPASALPSDRAHFQTGTGGMTSIGISHKAVVDDDVDEFADFQSAAPTLAMPVAGAKKFKVIREG